MLSTKILHVHFLSTVDKFELQTTFKYYLHILTIHTNNFSCSE